MQEYQAKENVGVFWEKKLRELSLQRKRNIDQTKKTMRIVQQQAGEFEKKELKLIDALNQRSSYLHKIRKSQLTNRELKGETVHI